MHCRSQQPERDWELIDSIERADGQNEIINAGLGLPMILDNCLTPSSSGEEWTWVEDVHLASMHLPRPRRIWAAEEERAVKAARD